MCQLFMHLGSKVTLATNAGDSPNSFKGFSYEFPIKYWAKASFGLPMPKIFAFSKSSLFEYFKNNTSYCNSREYLPLAIDAITPPSTRRSIPVMNDESSLNRNSAALAISSDVPTLFAGDELIIS